MNRRGWGQSWTDETQTWDQIVNEPVWWHSLAYDPLDVQFETSCLEYKERSEQIIISELGFLPEVEVRMYYDVRIRQALKGLEDQSITQEFYEKLIGNYLRTLKNKFNLQ
tara:strand:- start:210 stop:539 length:330 start_codon:yes stop_codon:yes gene_type:complete